MANRSITLNSQTHYPNSIEGGRVKIGEVLEADDGSSTPVYTGAKGKWTLTWDKPKESIVAQLQAIALLTVNFTYVDENGASYTVFVPPRDGITRRMNFADSRSNKGASWSIVLQLVEA